METGSTTQEDCTLTCPRGLEDLFSLLGPGESGPTELGGWGSGAILAPGESCMLASWAAYSCCKKGKKQPQGVNVPSQPPLKSLPPPHPSLLLSAFLRHSFLLCLSFFFILAQNLAKDLREIAVLQNHTPRSFFFVAVFLFIRFAVGREDLISLVNYIPSLTLCTSVGTDSTSQFRHLNHRFIKEYMYHYPNSLPLSFHDTL